MDRAIAVVGAPSSIGIRPYDDGEPRHLDRAPGVLRDRNVIARLGAVDFGDVMPPRRPNNCAPLPGHVRNENQVIAYSRMLAERVAGAIGGGRFGVVLGGDCSIVLGCLLGARLSARGPLGLVYIDAHADFASPPESTSRSVTSMSLALAAGRGDTPLARLAGDAQLVNGRRAALLGRRDVAAGCGSVAIQASSILDLPGDQLAKHTAVEMAAAALARVASPEVRGFWIHLDVDVLSPTVMPAVDSPEPGGLMPNDLAALLMPIVHHPLALGLDVSIYDPALDADRSCARLLVNLLERITI